MTFRASVVSGFAFCSVSFASGLGCHAPSAPSREGTIDFVVRQGHLTAPGAAVTGSFDVRGLDNDERASVGIGRGAGRTLQLRLPAGAYTVSWKPAPSAESASAASATLNQANPTWPQIVVVTPDGSAVVDVMLGSRGASADKPIELASVGTGSAL